MYAKYTNSASGGDRARVARFVFDLSDAEGTQMINPNNITKPGDSETYKFIVTNEKDGKINETTTGYTMQLKVSGTMPLEAKITENDQEICKVDHSDPNSAESEEDKISDKITFMAAEKAAHTYQLTVTWPENQTDASYANGNATGSLELIVKGQQED